jgi:acetate kinase
MDWLGLKLDEQKNRTLPRGEGGDISAADSRVKILALPTDEELMIAQDTVRCVAGSTRG